MLAHRDTVLIFDKNELIPPAWHDRLLTGELVFNPTLAAVEGGYAMCYRIVPPSGEFRSLATCRLSPDLRVVPESATPLSDLVTFARPAGLDERARTWHADPRYQRLGDRLFVTWNDGSNRPANHQFIAEMTADGLRPAGPARELVLYGMERRTIEKNWTLFERDGQVRVVYSCDPQVILSADLGHPAEVPCLLAADTTWTNTYSPIFGVMRGGAQPVLRRLDGQERFLSVVHSSYKMPGGRYYEMCAYEFESTPPFQVTRAVSRPIALSMMGAESFEFNRLNKEVNSVVYPCGCIIAGEEALVSYGINDENLAIARIALADIDAALQPVKTRRVNFVMTQRIPEPPPEGLFGPEAKNGVPLFWWDTAGKRFDGVVGERRFATGNFGDIASRDIVMRVAGIATAKPVAGRRKLLSTGSVLHLANDGDVIWGSGLKGTARDLPPGVKTLDIRAVRGPLTLAFLRERGFDVSKVADVFDPGCLVKDLYAAEIAAYDIERNRGMGPFRIVPHYRDDLYMRRMHKDLHPAFLTVDCSPQQMVERMLGTEAVYSSSLHGVIFAESLGIPAYWLKSVGGEDDFKFYDYYYGTSRYQVKCFDTLSEAMTSKPMPLPTFRPEAYLATFPHDALESLMAGHHGLGPGCATRPVASDKNGGMEIIGWHPDAGRTGSNGFWLIGEKSGCGLRLALPQGAPHVLELTVRPFNHPALPSPQEIVLTVAGRYSYALNWPKGDVESRVLLIPVSSDILEGPFLRLESAAKHAISPAMLKAGVIKDALTVCLQRIALKPLAVGRAEAARQQEEGCPVPGRFLSDEPQALASRRDASAHGSEGDEA